MSAYLGCQLKFELRLLYLTTKLPYEIQNWLELIFNSWKASFMSLKRSIIRQVWYCMGLAWPSLAYLLQNTKAGSKKFPAEPLFEYFLQLADEKKYSKNSAAGNFFLPFLFCDGFRHFTGFLLMYLFCFELFKEILENGLVIFFSNSSLCATNVQSCAY